MSGNDLGKAVVEERGRGLLCVIRLTVSSLLGPKMNARQQRHVGALGNTLGETQGEGITPEAPRDHPGSPRLTSAIPEGGERRRRMLTRQNRKGNIAPSSPKFLMNGVNH